MPDTLRAFVAVEIAEPVREPVLSVIGRLRAVGGDVKWVARENLHFTLNFLGDVPTTQTADVCHAVTECVAAVRPFTLSVHGTGAFPNLRRPRTVWLGAEVGVEEIVELQCCLTKALKTLGFLPEGKRYQPHLTLGRIRTPGQILSGLSRLLEQAADEEIGRFEVREVTIFSSDLTPKGPVYQALCRAPLAGM